jgi:transcriptional regulator of aromatic amino acid metabolism
METLPVSIALESYSTKELVDELSKRKEVKLMQLVNNGCIMRIGQDWVVRGKATILVVKE